MLSEEKGEIVLYQPSESVRLEVRLQDETVWLTQQQMAELFSTTKQNVSLHINNIFREGELEMFSVVKESLTTAADGKKYKTKFYNLDVIISVGYRVKSPKVQSRDDEAFPISGPSFNKYFRNPDFQNEEKWREPAKVLQDVRSKIAE